MALLEAACLWASHGETVGGRAQQYLIDGEAFDLMLLCGRLCDTVAGLIPEDQKEALLFRGQAGPFGAF